MTITRGFGSSRARALVVLAGTLGLVLLLAAVAAKGATTPPAARAQMVPLPPYFSGEVYFVQHQHQPDSVLAVEWDGKSSLLLDKYDRVTKSRTQVTLLTGLASWQSGRLFCEEDSQDRVWIAFQGVFGFWSPSDGSFHQVALPQAPKLAVSPAWDNYQPDAIAAQPVLGMTVGGNGHVYVARDFSHAVLDYDTSAGAFSVHAMPGFIDGPGALRRVGRDILVEEHTQIVPGSPWRGVYALYRVDTGSWEAAPVSEPVVGTTSDGVWVLSRKGGPLQQISPSTTMSAPTATLQSRGSAVPQSIWSDENGVVIAVDGVGRVWHVPPGSRIARFDPISGSDSFYEVPTIEPIRPVMPGQRKVLSTPQVTSTYIDDDGSVWVSYTAGLSYVGVIGVGQ